MKTYEEWLEEFTKKIKENYEYHRLDKQLAGYVYEVPKPATVLPRGSGPRGAFGIGEGEPLPEPYLISTQDVTPRNIGFSLDLKDWAEEKEFTYMDTLLSDLARNLSNRGGYTILRAMYEKAGFTMKAETEGKLTKTDIAKAEHWIGNQGSYADTLVIHPEQQAEFIIKNEIWHKSRIPIGFIREEQREQPHYAGMLNGIDVYWTPLVKGLAFVYRKNEIIVLNTPLKIDFDNMTRPKSLIIEQYCSSAAVDPRGVAKITLKEKAEK